MSTTRLCKRSVRSRKRTTLPGDLLIDILLRIPAKRLGEFRRVSKFFRRLIDSPEFIQKHYDRWIKTRPSVIIQGSNISSAIESTEFLVDYDSAKSQVTAYTFIIPNMNKWETAEFVGCCRGILCYNIINRQSKSNSTCLAFWNPLTRAYRRSIEHDDRPIPASFTRYRTWYSLGYNAVTDDLKVLKMTRYKHSRGTPRDDQVYAFAVYSSETDSWRRVEGSVFNKLSTLSSDSSDVFLEGNNCMHILVSDDTHDTLRILAFDFAAEEFNLKVPMPQQCRGINVGEQVGLLSLDGCLCFYRNPGRDRLEVWMMKEYGVEESWNRVFSLKPSHEHLFYKNLVPRAFVNYKGRRKLLVSSTDPMMAGLYLCDGKEEEEEEVKEFFHILKQHLHWTYLKTQHFEFAATHRQP